MHERVVVAVDPREPGTRAVEEAAVLARAHGAELVVAVAYPNQLTTAQRRERDGAPTEEQWRLSPGSIAEAVAQAAARRARAFAGDEAAIRTRCEPGRPAAVLAALTHDLAADLLLVELSHRRGAGAITPRVLRGLERRAACEVVLVGAGPALPAALPLPGTSTATA